MTGLQAVKNWSRRRAVKLGIIPGPHARPAEADVSVEGGPSWFALCVGAWAVMMGALMASAPLIQQPAYLLKVGVALVAAFPVAYYLHFSRVSRWAVNWTVLLVAVTLGFLEFRVTLGPESEAATHGLAMSYGVLVKFFLWIMAFRAFAMRSLNDLVLSALPAVSCVILVLAVMPTPPAAVGTALVVGGILYLLAAERGVQVAREGERTPPIRQVVWEHSPRRGAALNTWQAVSAMVLLVALVAGGVSSYMGLSSGLGRAMRDVLAMHLAEYLVGDRRTYAAPPVVELSGATPSQSDRVIFVVECDRGENWRQQTYARYTGRAWQRTRGPKIRGTRVDEDLWLLDTSLVSGFREQGALEVRQVFHVRTTLSATLPGLFLGSQVRADVRGMVTGEDGVLYCSGYVDVGETYEVVSLLPALGPAPAEGPLPPMPEELRELYLQLPEDLPRRVRDLAESLVKEARGPYDAALVIREYLVSTYPYTLTPPPRPRERDFVDHFLFDARSGFCNHYSSAMAVMCRAVGLPTRLVTGFVAGEFDPENDTYEVQEKDAHSWVEVYVEGRGWQSFDPTPPLDEEEEAGTFAGFLRRGVDLLADAALALAAWAGIHAAPVSAGLGGALTLVLVLVTRRRDAFRRVQDRDPLASPGRRVRFAYDQMLRWLTWCGVPRRATQAPLEYLEGMPSWVAPALEDARTITNYHLRARYGGVEPAADHAAEAEQALLRLRPMLLGRELRG